jgi:hypothetical protein
MKFPDFTLPIVKMTSSINSYSSSEIYTLDENIIFDSTNNLYW